MSRIDKQKINIETKQQQHQLHQTTSRQSVFGRLGNRHEENAPEDRQFHVESVKHIRNTASTSASIMKHHSSKSGSGHHHRLDDADPDLLEQKRAELKKELELQLKMESAARKPKSSGMVAGSKSSVEMARKRKQMARRSSSSSSSSSSGSDSSSDSSSSDSGPGRRTAKARKNAKTKRHQSSSSSGDEDPRRKAKAVASSSGATKTKRVCHKKLDASGKVKAHHTKKSTLDKPNLIVHRKRTPSPSQIVVRKHQRPISPGSAMKSSSSKVPSKMYADQGVALKHHRMKEHSQQMVGGSPTVPGHHRASDKEREFQLREREREREREQQQHLRSRERMRSRSPPPMRMRSRSPPGGPKRLSRPRDVKQRSPPNVSQRRASPKSRSGTGGSAVISGIRRGDRTPERIIIKKDVSGKRHESSREREHRRERDRERESAALREKDRLEMIRLQEQRRERERLDQDRLRVKVIDPRDREVDQRVGKSERLLPRPAERAMAIAAARDQARDKSEERSVDMHHRPRSHSHSRSNRDRNDVYADRGGYDRMDERYEMHRRSDMDRSSAGLIRDDRSDRGGGERDREYVSVRRREDSRGRIIEESIVHDPYLPREKVRGGPISERDRSIEREREHRYGGDRDRERTHGDASRYDEHGARGGGSVDERRGRGGSERGHDYGRPTSRGGYIDEPTRGGPHRPPPESHRERGEPERESWYRDGGNEPSSSRGDDRGHGHHYDRHAGRDWDHNDRSTGNRQSSVGRGEGNYPMDDRRRDGNANPDWSAGNERPWSDGRGMDRGHVSERGGGAHGDRGHSGDRPPNWHHSERDVENWDAPEDYGPGGDFHRGGHAAEKIHHDIEPPLVHGIGSGNRGGPGNRRWPNWRGGRGGGRGGGGGNEHHVPQGNLFRRQNQMHNQQDGFQDHQGDHSFRRQPGGGPEYQQPHHHGHNAFSTSIVRPLLSLPPLKPPIMDDVIPMILLPNMTQKKLLPTTVLNPVVINAIANKEEASSVAPSKPLVVAEPQTPNEADEEKQIPDKTEGLNEVGASLTKEAIADGTLPDTEAGAEGEEDALSEISDDADDILNRQEQEAAAAALLAAASLVVLPTAPLQQKPALLPTPPFKVGEFPRLLVNQPFAPINLLPMPFVDDHHLHHMHHHHHHPNAILIKPPVVSVIPNNDLHAEPNADDLDLDFEEISDGELEEEARIRGLGDALGVDWASLVEESKAKANEQRSNVFASAKQRWQPHRILLDVGVSFRMAGKEFASNVLNAAHRKLTAEEAEARQHQEAAANKQKVEEQPEFTIKKEVQDDEYCENPTTTTANITEQAVFNMKTIEEHDEMGEPPQAELLIHPIACVQVASRVNAEIRKNVVFGMTGPFSRALSAQKDVQMRRQLCGLSMKPCGGQLKTRPIGGGVDYAAMARQLFEKALGQVN